MTPIEQLAAARLNVVGPYLPAREEWLKGWTGPVEYLDHEAAENGDADESTWRPAITNALGMVWYEDDACEWRPADRDRPTLRLDTRRAEVRHLLCDLGIAPEWARKSAVACWCAGMGVRIVKEFPPWRQRDPRRQDFERVGANDGRYLHVAAGGQMSGFMGDTDRKWVPWWRWSLSRFDGHFVTVAEGREDTPELARAASDVAALANAHILIEPDGYYVPLADGGIGWWADDTDRK